MVPIDGYGIDFVIARSISPTAGLPDFELSDFTPEELENNFHLWGVEPGMTNIFTSSDGHGDIPHQIRKYSTAEYYVRAGMTSSKTANPVTYSLYVRSVLDNLFIILAFYDDRFTSFRHLNYIGRQKADAEMANVFITGGKKYLKREVKQKGRDLKRKLPVARARRQVNEEQGRNKGKKTSTKRRPLPFENVVFGYDSLKNN
ncbi:hypothetical protein INT47_010208 [Mucor saturninus]|uniref:Uncharacterized protein n=1 Tax=Mucor saturninus TaxID=64648 RepID=A0A8H7RE01_9FUNG|nr:hypothetical protein INT47_010208 [Mucor saturninus]